MGTFAVQLAKHLGAIVTAVCSAGKAEMVRTLGADRVIDYGQEDFTRRTDRYDLIFAVNGYHPILDYKRALRPNGRYVMAGGTAAQMFEALLLGPLVFMASGKKMTSASWSPNPKDLALLAALVEAGKLKPLIETHYPLSGVPDAIRHLADGHARAKVVIDVAA